VSKYISDLYSAKVSEANQRGMICYVSVIIQHYPSIRKAVSAQLVYFYTKG